MCSEARASERARQQFNLHQQRRAEASCEKADAVAQLFDERVHLCSRVVKVGAGPQRAGHAQVAVCRLRAQVARAHSNARLQRQGQSASSALASAHAGGHTPART